MRSCGGRRVGRGTIGRDGPGRQSQCGEARLLVFAPEPAHVSAMKSPERRFPRRPAADRHAGHGRPALRALGDLSLRPFRRGGDGADRQQAGAGAQLRRPAGAAQDRGAAPISRERRVHFGGPVEHGRGFVLHSARIRRSKARACASAPDFAMTATVDILQDMARGRGPGAGAAGARLRRLGARAARGRDPGQRLADRAGRPRAGLRPARRGQMGGGAALALHRPAAPLGRGRAGLSDQGVR